MSNYSVPSNFDELQSTRLLKVADVAKITQLSSSQIYTMIQEGTLQAIRFGHAIRIHPHDLQKFIRENLTVPDNGFAAHP